MNKLKSFLIILLLVFLTFSFLMLPEYLFEKSSLRLLKTKENLTYNYEGEKISPSQLADLFCSGELEAEILPMFKETYTNSDVTALREKADNLIKNLFSGAYEELYPIISELITGTVTDYGERNVFVQNSLKKPVALNFISISFNKDDTNFSVFFEEKTQTVFCMEYVPVIVSSEESKENLSTASMLNYFFEYYFQTVLNTRCYNVYTTFEENRFLYCYNALAESKPEKHTQF